MENGFYQVQFSGPAIPGVTGIVTIENGVVRGGDDSYLYSGKLELPQEGELSGEITVAAYVPNAQSVFGPATRYTLTLTGKLVGTDKFQASGPASLPGAPHITISGTKIAALDLA